MTQDYFSAEKTGGSRDTIEITVDVKAEKVMDFANEIRSATLDKVLEIIDSLVRESNITIDNYNDVAIPSKALKAAVTALKEGNNG